MSPEQILAALAEVYATCTSYRDTGVVNTRFINPAGGGHTTTRPFETAFVRPDRFRFEYRSRHFEEDNWDRHIVWADDGDVRTWWDVTPGVKVPESLGLALAGATGVSGGSAHTVPALLLPNLVGGRRPTDSVEVVSLGDAPLGGVACYRLSVRFAPSPDDPDLEERVLRVTGRPMERAVESPETVWVDRGTFLIRRIEEATQFETFRTEEVTEYEPAVGVTVREEELRFDPPAAG
jgi:hypothetical protein